VPRRFCRFQPVRLGRQFQFHYLAKYLTPPFVRRFAHANQKLLDLLELIADVYLELLVQVHFLFQSAGQFQYGKDEFLPTHVESGLSHKGRQ
jgi:hypothetical protein